MHLFGRFKNIEEIEERLAKETPAYNGQPVILQSAVNYIFYPFFIESIAKNAPEAKLIVILRNPVERALSSYHYFKKMFREKRSQEEALIYNPKDDFNFSPDNSDFTYIEHGLYFRQISNCYKYFKKEQLLILDYDDLKIKPKELLNNIFIFLGIDASFTPGMNAKNITGNIKSEFLQSKILSHNKYRTWLVDNLVDSWFPVNKRKILKKKIFEFNTSKKKRQQSGKAPTGEGENDTIILKEKLKHYFRDDVKKLDTLLSTHFLEKWLGEQTIINKN